VQRTLDEVYGKGQVSLVQAAFRWMSHHSLMKESGTVWACMQEITTWEPLIKDTEPLCNAAVCPTTPFTGKGTWGNCSSCMYFQLNRHTPRVGREIVIYSNPRGGVIAFSTLPNPLHP
jgi:hypothetical protein